MPNPGMDYIELQADCVEPVDVADARLYCGLRYDDSSEDSLLGILISSAREELEQWVERWLASRPVTVRTPYAERICMRGPVESVDSVTLDDGTDISAAVSTDAHGVMILPDTARGHTVTIEITTGSECMPWMQQCILRMVRASLQDPDADPLTPAVRDTVARHARPPMGGYRRRTSA